MVRLPSPALANVNGKIVDSFEDKAKVCCDIGTDVNSLILTDAGGMLAVEFSGGIRMIVDTGNNPVELFAGKDKGSWVSCDEFCSLVFTVGVGIAVKF